MKKLFFILVIFFTAGSLHAQDADSLLSRYYDIKNALVSSDLEAASGAVSAFRKTIEEEKDFPQKNALLKVAVNMDKTTDLEKQRSLFKDLSTSMWQLVQASASLSQDVYYQYCPMKKAYWLSNEAAVKNPYYGAKMLTCGSVKDKKLQ